MTVLMTVELKEVVEYFMQDFVKTGIQMAYELFVIIISGKKKFSVARRRKWSYEVEVIVVGPGFDTGRSTKAS